MRENSKKIIFGSLVIVLITVAFLCVLDEEKLHKGVNMESQKNETLIGEEKSHNESNVDFKSKKDKEALDNTINCEKEEENKDEIYEIFDSEIGNHDSTEQNESEFTGKDDGGWSEKYTWEEFEALTTEQQIAFQNSFENMDAFDVWLQKAQYLDVEYPWEKEGKQPEKYTWEEFEALTTEQQIAFQNSFENMDAFDVWLQKAQHSDVEHPWEKGGKQPEKYTWEEFEKLTTEQQIAFQNSFENMDAFDVWLQKVQ